MKYDNDERIVLTLDAGGTNFVFSAIQAENEIVDPVRLPSYGDNLEKCLEMIKEGFHTIIEKIPGKPHAISFAFPGPADYPNGIIGDLSNLPGFRGGVALGPMLEQEFSMPVFINNDGDLFALGEAVAGLLPEINRKLVESASPKRYQNLVGITLGTGFGCGIIRNSEILLGDNSAGGEIWLMRSFINNRCFAEEDVSIRAVKRVYRELSGRKENLEPKDIFDISVGKREGDAGAAKKAFELMARSVADALANTITLIDGLIVIGGGLSGASSIFLDTVVKEMNGFIETIEGEKINRLVSRVFNLDNKNDLNEFLKGQHKEIQIPGSEKSVIYDPQKRIGLGLSRLGTSRAVALGAYFYALQQLD